MFEKKESIWDIRTLKRRWIAGVGISLVAIALLLAFLSHQELARTLEASALTDFTDSQNNEKVTKEGNNEAVTLNDGVFGP